MRKKKRFEVSVSGGFLLVAALLLYLDKDGLLPCALFAAVLHELGHWAAICFVGGRVRGLRLSVAGAAMELENPATLTYFDELLVTLSGPGVGLVAALIFARLGAVSGQGAYHLLAGLNLSLACFNLLPVRPLDGGQALYLLLSGVWEPSLADRITFWISLGLCLTLTAVGLWMVLQAERNFTLLLTSFWLLISLLRENRLVRQCGLV